MPVILANKLEKQSFNQDDFHKTLIVTSQDENENTVTTIYQGRATIGDPVRAQVGRCWTVKRTVITESETDGTTVEVTWAVDDNHQLKTDCHWSAITFQYGYEYLK